MDGARSGTYTIHPQQMHVDLPTNVDDPDINSIGDYAKPLDIPTDMTFFIFRIKSSTVFRELVDDAWQSGVDLHALPYDMVLQYDKKFRNMLADVEKAFGSIAAHTNAAGKQMLPGPDGQYRHTLWRQRNLAHFGMHSRFCLLHRPYLVRGSQEPQYAYSRMMCLKSARGVIETGKMLISLNPDMAALKVWVLNHHIFVSTVVLVMDFCFNPDEPRAKERKEEIIECFKLFENGPEGSTLAARGLQKLRAMLCDKKYAMKYKPCINIGPAKMDRAPSSSQGPLETEVPTKTGMETTYPFDPISTGYTFGSVNDVPLQSSMNFDYSALENINWDMNTDIGLFDELLQTVDYNGDTF
jgi:hypothetical protein